MKEFVCNKLSQLDKIAETLLEVHNTSRLFAFYGGMGAGKTTFIKVICSKLGVRDVVLSPTFSIINQYTTKESKPIYHFDFYRIKNIKEVYDIGYEDYFYSDNYCFIEWPEMITELLPEDTINVYIKEESKNKRIISF
ncbi:MAG: tRNA (adenosine(37)-N6)-threonylcarbamoyltransferase complex ATPase subunit type 1 TsaE [Bacteroidota bacterium]|nr:tRNA (adenosine(37)-N6)-threonylcarbamoyltransferase complex ATPase subunit type 1 TsaE [Bacteroidota bacterium]